MNLFPKPKTITYNDGKIDCSKGICLNKSDFDKALLGYALSRIRLKSDGVSLVVLRDENFKKEQYRLEVANDGIRVTASTERGAHYGLITLASILEEDEIPCLVIDDCPDIEDRGLMLDVSRGKVPKIEQVKKIIDIMADTKYNQLQLYFEGIIFNYKGFEKYTEGKNPVTAEYIKEIKDYCKERHIELVPNHNSFGHMMEWLAIDDLRPLAECPDGYDRTDEYNHTKHYEPGSLNPLDPCSITFVDSLYAQVLPHFESDYLNVGCDEAFELGEGASKEKAEKEGKTKVVTDYMKELDKVCKSYNKRMMFWSDMILETPDAAKDMPKDSVALIWGYEYEHPFTEQCGIIHDAGLDFYVVPGTSTWGSILGRSENAMKNQYYAAENAIKFGAKGYLLTEWGDFGHPQHPVVNYLPFAYGAGLCWNFDGNKDIEGAKEYLDDCVFEDKGFADYLYDCGMTYKLEPVKRFNITAYFTIVTEELGQNHYMKGQTIEDFDKITQFTKEKVAQLDSFANCSEWYKAEIKNSLELVGSIAQLGTFKLGRVFAKDEADALVSTLDAQMDEYKKLWTERNMPYNMAWFIGMLADRVEEFKKLN